MSLDPDPSTGEPVSVFECDDCGHQFQCVRAPMCCPDCGGSLERVEGFEAH
jgi:Zn finger protein HypA/HybF involved in hydrogenase expression